MIIVAKRIQDNNIIAISSEIIFQKNNDINIAAS